MGERLSQKFNIHGQNKNRAVEEGDRAYTYLFRFF